jgi:hypothetical protein
MGDCQQDSTARKGERRVLNLKGKMVEIFGVETLATFRWVDDELSALPPKAPFVPWWSSRRAELASRLPEEMTHGVAPRSIPDHLKADLSRFVLLGELL